MNEMAQGDVNEDEEDLFKELEMEVAKEKAAVVNQRLQQTHQQPVSPVSVVPQSYVPQQQSKQVYAPMGNSSTGGQQSQYQTKISGSTATGLTSQYQPQAQYQQQYQQQAQYQQQVPQTQYKPKAANHMDEITRMLNG